jgi:hypothetical protein
MAATNSQQKVPDTIATASTGDARQVGTATVPTPSTTSAAGASRERGVTLRDTSVNSVTLNYEPNRERAKQENLKANTPSRGFPERPSR